LQPQSRFILAGGLRTHFIEAGEGFAVVLLHSGEFGASAQLSWERTIGPLSRHFRVIAPDWSGYGQTEKVFSFDDMWGFRIRHITAFLGAMGIQKAHFIGNSMGATLLLQVAAQTPCPWPIERAVAISGGGTIPESAARETLNSYDGSRDHMRRIIETLFVDPSFANDETYVERRHASSLEPGGWEATAAARFRAPWKTSGARMPQPPDYSGISRPILLITGDRDCLREADFGQDLQKQIPGSELYVVAEAGHCAHIEKSQEVNARIAKFLGGM
jgi:pimeloyl-ACP methyl ester carboxylesterase